MKNKTILFAIVISSFFGCEIVTDFPGDWITDSTPPDLYQISGNMDVNQPVEVELLDNGNANIILELTNPLPQAEAGDEELASLLGNAIELTVINEEGGTTANLTQGQKVDGTPSDPGDYQITLNADRTQITIVFRNETDNGKSLNPEGDYTATISVATNDYFVIEVFEVDVEIVEE